MTIKELNEKIEDSGLSRAEIARLSGVSESSLSRIKNDKNYDPTLSTVTSIILAIEPDYRNKDTGDVFYIGDQIIEVDKKNMTCVNAEFNNPFVPRRFELFKTKEQAEKWIEENKPKYEEGCYYKAVISGCQKVIEYHSNLFYITGSLHTYSESDFDKIGDKIEL